MYNLKSKIKPIFLLADSQLLFYKSSDGLFMERVRRCFEGQILPKKVKAAYIGASNGDDPLFYKLFQEALAQIEVRDFRFVKSCSDPYDTQYLVRANIIFLSGGNVLLGWQAMKRNSWVKALINKYHEGAILMGTSAGAIQLGMKAFAYKDKSQYLDTGYLHLVDWFIDVHSNDNWHTLKEDLSVAGHGAKGVGIPHGAGLICYQDGTLQAVRYPSIKFTNIDGRIESYLLNP